MSGTDAFFDTNVLLYLLSGDDARSGSAEALLAEGGVISVQVLNEFAAVASRKLRMSWPEIREILDTIRAVCRVEPVTDRTHDRAMVLAQRHGFSVDDGLILASALLAGCTVLLSEGLQDDQRIDDRLSVRNPFRA